MIRRIESSPRTLARTGQPHDGRDRIAAAAERLRSFAGSALLRARIVALPVAFSLLAPAHADAAVGVNKSFAPNSVIAGQVSTLTIVLLNPNASSATAVAVTDTLPAGVVVATPLSIGSNTCGFATGLVVAGGTSIPLSGGTIPPISAGVPGQCQLTVNVVSSTPNTYLNTIGAGTVSSSNGTNPQDAQATLVVSAPANITGTKAFAPANVHGNGTASTLTITLTNPNVVPLNLSAAFTDTLPATITIATPSNFVTTCLPGTVVASAPATNPATVSLTTGVIPASASCTIKVDVIARNPNVATNAASTNTIAAGALKTVEGATSPAIAANVTVQTGGAITKAFAPATIPAGGATPSTLTITISNFNNSILTPITFTDAWPATMTVNGAPTTTCVGGVLTNTANSVTLTGATLPAAPSPAAGAATCTITVPVLATASTTNNIAAGNFGGVAYSGSGNVTLTVSTITGSKTFSAPVVQTATTTMTITLNNNSTTSAATITTITDNLLTTMGAGFTVPTGAVPGGTCGSSLTSPLPATTITLAGGTIPINGSCTITLPVAISATAPTGNRTNTIAVNGVVTSLGNNTVAISGTVNVLRALTVAKAFVPATVLAGTKSTLIVTLTRTGGALALDNITFTDNLSATMGAGFVVATPPNASTTCNNATNTATLTAVAGATNFGISGGGLNGGAGNTVCTVIVDVATPPAAAAATYANHILANAVTTTQGVLNGDAAANLVITAPTAVTVNKSFSPTTIAVGAAAFSTMTIQIRNNNAGAIALTGVGLVDNLPAGMVFATVPTPTLNACGAATLTPSAVAPWKLTLANASIAAGAICTATIRVSAMVAGNMINNIPPSAVTSAQGVTNPLQGTATLAATGTVNLAVTKSDGVASVIPGTATTYTIKVSNSGPNDVAGLGVNDTPPAGETFTSWTCAPAGTATCTASGAGPIADLANIPNGSSVTYTVIAAIAAGATGTITNTVNLAVPGSVINNGGTTASDTDTLTPQADLSITKTDGQATYTAGNPITYTIVASNAGPSAVTGATVADAVPIAITGVNWTCAASAGSGCPAGGAGNINALVNLLPGGMATFTLTGTVSASTVGNLVNTATVTVPAGVTDPTPANNSATDTDTPNPVADLSITKTDGQASAIPGNPITYTIVASNAGPSAVTGATVADTVPAAITGANWTCVASAGSSCPASGAGNINALVNLLPGGTATFTLTGTVSAAATGTIANTATIAPPGGITDPNPGNNSATDTDTLTAQVSLNVLKTDGSATYTPGGIATYTVTVTNGGPSSATNLTVADPLPAGLTLTANATCVATGAATCGTVTGTTGQTSFGTTAASVGAGAANKLVFTVPVAFAPGMIADPVLNTATATDLASAGPGSTASSTDSDARFAKVSLNVVKDDGSATYTPGGTGTYTVTVTNAGPSFATSVTVTDALPAGLTLTANATCAASGAATCGTVTGNTGQTSFGTTGATVGAAAADKLVFSVPVAFASGMTTDPLVNSATATDLGASGAGSTATGSDSDTRSAAVTLVVVKDDGATTYTPGSTATYTVTVSNTGLTDALGVNVTDALPIGLTLTANATCAANGTSSCGTVTGVTGQTSFGTTGAVVVSGGANTIVFTVPVAFAPGMSTNPLVNTATATDVPSGATASGADSDTLSADVTLTVNKTDGSATYTPGGTATYTVTVGNTGVSDALNVNVADALPAGLTLTANVTCAANGTSSCGAVTGSTGQTSFSAAAARVNAGGANTLVFTVPVAFAPGMTTDPLVNAATATDVPSGNTATGNDSDTFSPLVTLGVAKTDGSATYTPGAMATYTVTVTNSGLSDALNVTVTDPLPAGLALTGNATCAAGGTSSCGTVTGTTGQTSFGATLARVNAGAANALVFTVPVAFATGMSANPLINTATATDFASGIAANGQDSDVLLPNVTLTVTKTDGSATYTPGGTATYTVTIANSGLSDALNVTVADALPAGLTLSANATCVANGTSICGTVAGTTGQTSFGATTARVDAGAANTLVFTVPVAFAPGMNANPLINTASATDAPSGATASGQDSDTLSPNVSLVVAKTDGSATYTPGGAGTYTITVANTGLSDAVNVTVTDPLPAGLSLSANATCVANGTSSCGTVTGTTGQTSFGATLARVGAGGANTLIFTVPVAFGAGMTTNPLVNTATATDVASGATASGSDSDTLSTNVALVVIKTDGSATYTPGTNATYTVTVTDVGVTDALNVSVVDALPAGVTLSANATCVASGTSSCGTVTGTTGQTSFGATAARVVPGGANALVFTVPVAFAPGMSTNPLVNTATATDLASGASASGSDSDALFAVAGLAVTKSDGSATYSPGGIATYTIVLTNGGPSNAGNITVADPLPAGVTLTAPATCVATGAATCGTVTGSTGGTSLGTTGGTIAAGAANRLTFTAPVKFAASLVTNPLVNTVTVSDPSAPGPVTASDSDTFAPSADLAIIKTGPPSLTLGAQITYSVTVSNNGPSSGDGATFSDPVPAAVVAVSATCGTPLGGAVCGIVNISGNSVTSTIPTLPVGGSVVITIKGSALSVGTIVNTASVAPPPGVGDPNPNNSSSTATTFVTSGPTTPIPVDSRWALAALFVLLSVAGMRGAAARGRPTR